MSITVNLNKKKFESLSGNTLVIFSTLNKTAPLGKVEKPLIELFKSDDNCSGKAGETVFFRSANLANFTNILFLGLGERKEITSESFRLAAASAFQTLKTNKANNATFHLDSAAGLLKKQTAIGRALTEGIILSSYSYDDCKKKKDETKLSVELSSGNKASHKELEKGINEGLILAESTNFSRWLGDSPGNKMNPTILANETAKEGKSAGLKVTILDKAKIKKQNMNALLGVSAGSSQDPRFIILEHKGAAASKKPICLVGKGLTFDAGGISIKPSPGMEEMKYDMCGGANVIGAMLAISRLKLKVNVVALVPASENLLGPAATKPGDILTAKDGTTIEVNNTDAEGRLILADALCYANSLKPQMVIDTATLTGAMVVALGSSYTGIFCENDGLLKKIKTAADNANERVWHMPLSADHTSDIKGTYADLSNIGASREAGSSTAAAFLKHFVDEKIPWAHFDIAGTAWHNGKRAAYHPKKGASGIMVRTFVELARLY